MTHTRIRVGIVGAGTMGSHYGAAMAGPLSARARVVAVCDGDPARAAALAERTGAQAFGALDAMLAAVELDMVYLAVPDHAHAEPAIACLEAGVPVLVEKPLATTDEDATRIADAARRTGTPIEVNFSNRWNPPYAAAHEAVAAGEIGDVIGVNARLSNSLQIPRGIPWAANTTAGWFLLSHIFDLGQWMVGAPAVSVLARGRRGRLRDEGIDTFDLIQASVQYPRNANGLYEAAWVLPDGMPSPVDMKFQVIGTDGMLAVDTSNQMIVVARQDRVRMPSVLDWTQARLNAFFDRVATAEFDGELLQAGLDNTRLLVALHESLAAASPTVVELGTETER